MMRNWLPFLLGASAVLGWADAGDPPARVARLNYIDGSVSFRPDSDERWSAATLNYPLTLGDHLWTEAGARAEMHIGSTAVRLGPETAANFLNLEDRAVQLSSSQGIVIVRIRRLDPDESFELDTPNAAVTLLREGEYRFDINPDNGITALVVRAGDAEVTAAGGSAFPVHAGQSARVVGAENPSTELDSARAVDEFDRWARIRDECEDRAAAVSERYVSREMIGYEDLNEYGHWRDVPGYGWVWVPASVGPDWAPYRYGHWAYVFPWGWTWIDDAPWGFAPFHYGRWVYAGGGWGWVPGAIVPRPIYAPALVAWVGGSQFGAGVGWFPLGPREVYMPSYRVSPRYVERMNIAQVHVTNVNVTNMTYVNRHAATVVSRADFEGSRHIGRSAMVVSQRDIASAQVVNTVPVGRPERGYVRGPAGAAPPARVERRTVVVRSAPALQSAPVRRVSSEPRPARIEAQRPVVSAPVRVPPAQSTPADRPRVFGRSGK